MAENIFLDILGKEYKIGMKNNGFSIAIGAGDMHSAIRVNEIAGSNAKRKCCLYGIDHDSVSL